MKHVVCWRPDLVSQVINIDADHVADPIFWAVDTETPIQTRAGETGPLREQTTGGIVDALLDPQRNHFQLAVLGPAGAGKSHLIHRMRQEIERRPGFEVIPIRRLETNLRAVLEKLISRLPTEAQARYIEDLRRAGPSLSTPAAQKSSLLDGLAQAIEEDTVDPQSALDPDLERELLRTLPSLFRDPYLREVKFLRPAEVVPELVDRLFSSREGKRVEEEVLFSAANLPLSGVDPRNCSAPARDALEVFTFDTDTTVPAVLQVVNRNLGSAITRALNFTGDQLGDLLGRIRERLKSEGKELVILFEEFARLQGYDLAMLAALLVQGDDKLCRVRWALACTTGRFRALPDTVRSRMDLLVDMESSPSRPDLGLFSGRYLNAVRLGANRLASAFAAPERALPNACTDCTWRGECFEAFGAVGAADDQVGLYPFTTGALNTLARRSGADDGEAFNPREFQKQVLKPVLIDEAPELKGDRFPTARFLTQMGGPSITNLERGRLQERAGAAYDRYLAYFQLWNEGRFSGASPRIMRAFGLESLAGLEGGATTTSPPPQPPGPTTVATPVAKSTAIDRDAEEISRWVDDGPLSQNLAQRLRAALFPLVERAIDWDALGLSQAIFSGATAGSRPFRNLSLQFVRQGAGGGASPPVVVELPLKRDGVSFSTTALGLESLLKFEKTGDWAQSNGLVGLAAVDDLAAVCAAEVGRQLKTLRGGSDWDPIAGAAEILLIGAALGGAISPNQASDEKLLEAMFQPMPDCPYADAKLRTLYDRLQRRRTALQDLVRAHVSASKGGRVGRSIDPRLLREAARRLRRDKWSLGRSPQPRPDVYAEAGTLYDLVKRDLSPALEAERSGRREWLIAVDEALGGMGKQDVLGAVRTVIESASAAGVPVSSRTLEDAQQTFTGVQFDAAVRAVRLIEAADPPQAELLHYSRGRADAVEASSKLIKAWNDFLTAAEADVERRRAEAGADELSHNVARVTTAIDGLDAELRGLGAGQ
ncbi:MAG: protein DpdH [Caulobacteraceae bacterium]